MVNVSLVSDPEPSPQEVSKMTTKSRRVMVLPALAASVALGACGTTTVDPKSGENVIKNNIAKLSAGVASVKSVSCPGGVKPKDGNTLKCKVTLIQKSNGSEHKGTITVHITGGGKKVEFGPTDVQVP